MVSAGNFFETWIFSFGLMLFMLSILTVFGAFVYALMARIWGEAPDYAAIAHMGWMEKEPPIRKAA